MYFSLIWDWDFNNMSKIRARGRLFEIEVVAKIAAVNQQQQQQRIEEDQHDGRR